MDLLPLLLLTAAMLCLGGLEVTRLARRPRLAWFLFPTVYVLLTLGEVAHDGGSGEGFLGAALWIMLLSPPVAHLLPLLDPAPQTGLWLLWGCGLLPWTLAATVLAWRERGTATVATVFLGAAAGAIGYGGNW